MLNLMNNFLVFLVFVVYFRGSSSVFNTPISETSHCHHGLGFSSSPCPRVPKSCMSIKTMYMNIWYANMVHSRWMLGLRCEILQCQTSPETVKDWLVFQAQSPAITAWQRLWPYCVVQTHQPSFMFVTWYATWHWSWQTAQSTFFYQHL